MLKLRDERVFTFDLTEQKPVLDKDGSQKLDDKKQPVFESIIQASFIFDFPYAEEKDYSTLADMLRKKMVLGESEEAKEYNKNAFKSSAQNVEYMMIRKALVNWKNVAYADGTPIPVKDAKNNIIEKNQKLVFEAVVFSPIWAEVYTAFNGLEVKN